MLWSVWAEGSYRHPPPYAHSISVDPKGPKGVIISPEESNGVLRGLGKMSLLILCYLGVSNQLSILFL